MPINAPKENSQTFQTNVFGIPTRLNHIINKQPIAVNMFHIENPIENFIKPYPVNINALSNQLALFP